MIQKSTHYKENTACREDCFINESGYTKRRLDRIEKKINLPPVPMLVREKKKVYGVPSALNSERIKGEKDLKNNKR